VLNAVVECRRTDIPTVAKPTDGFLSEAHNGVTTLPPTRKDKMTHRELFPLNEPQLSSQQQPIATQFERHPSLVDGSNEPPMDVLPTAL
jgi:hypothetical protein